MNNFSVSFVLLTWVENTKDFEESKELCDKLNEFILSVETGNSYLVRAQKALDNAVRPVVAPQKFDTASKKSLQLQVRFLDVAVNKIAEQLSLLEYEILICVKPKEFLKQVGKVGDCR